MFQTSWLTVLGLAVEILGLGLLFRELLKSKSSSLSTAEFQQKQGAIDAEARQLVLGLNKGLLSLSSFIGQYLSILEMEAEYREDPSALLRKAEGDAAVSEVLSFLQGKTPHNLRSLAVGRFVQAQASLPSSSVVDRGLQLIEAGRTEMARMYEAAAQETRDLRNLARWGVVLVAIGAAAQFVDLLFIDTPEHVPQFQSAA